MTTISPNTLSQSPVRPFAPQPSTSSEARKGAIVRQRIAMAAVLTAFVLIFGTALGIALGPTAILLYVTAVPVPLFLLWVSTDALRADEID
jgi:hypothetical protein